MSAHESPGNESGDGIQRKQDIGRNQCPRVLIVEDDEEMRQLLSEVLKEEGWESVEASNGAEGLIHLHRECFDAVIMDQKMPGLSGLDLLPGIRTICPRTPVILITAFGDTAMQNDAMKNGAFDFLFKPFRMEALVVALRRSQARRELAAGAFDAEKWDRYSMGWGSELLSRASRLGHGGRDEDRKPESA